MSAVLVTRKQPLLREPPAGIAETLRQESSDVRLNPITGHSASCFDTQFRR